MIACKYPGCRILVCRKTRHALTNTALVTFEQEVVPAGSPMIGTMHRKNRQEYQFPNGSTIVCGGMDNPEKILSSQYDVIYFQEATEFTQDDWEMAMSRLRNGVVPYQQIIGDCNPSYPQHWLKRRCDDGICQLITSVHEDNPVLYDETRQEWTARGLEYLSTLDALSGARRLRLREGQWAMPEGARWPQFNTNVHTFEGWKLWPFGVPEGWVKWLSLDYGTKDPYCCLWHTMDPSKRNIYTYREDYETNLFADEQAKRMIEISPENESYDTIKADPNIWTPFPRHEAGSVKKSAHDLYKAVFRRDRRFGRMVKGFNRSRMHGFMFIDALLNYDNEDVPNWHISTSCPNLIKELQGATYKKVGQSFVEEDIDGDDHAIAASVYGLYDNYFIVKEKDDTIDYEQIKAERLEARSKTSNENFKRFTEAINRRGRLALGTRRRR